VPNDWEIMSDAEDPGLNMRHATVDEVVTSWPEVKGKNVFGHRGYVRSGRMFGFLHPNGVAVKAWADEADELYLLEGVTAFSYNGMEMRAWPILPLRTDAEADEVIQRLHHAWERAV
jgi:hypothetical protein